MARLEETVTRFLSQKRIAVAGVSRRGGMPANAIYRKLRSSGYTVFAINPNAAEVEGDSAYPNLHAVPEGVQAVVIATPAAAAETIVHECADLGIGLVWMHRSFGAGSVSPAAAEFGRSRGISVIDGGCPMMFLEPDFGHLCMKWILRWTGGLPKKA